MKTSINREQILTILRSLDLSLKQETDVKRYKEQQELYLYLLNHLNK